MVGVKEKLITDMGDTVDQSPAQEPGRMSLSG